MTKEQSILDYINQHGTVMVGDICRRFEVSESTARRAILRLKEEGKIIKCHGGAISLHAKPFAVSDETWNARFEAKKAIARKAAEIVEDHSTVILLGGSTVASLCDFIKDKRLTVITNSMMVLLNLQNAESIKLIVLGGLYNRDRLEVSGMLTSTGMRNFRADQLFMGTTTFNDKDGFVTEDQDSVEQYRACMEASAISCVLADSAKFQYGGTAVIARPPQIQYLFTDAGLSQSARLSLREKGMRVVIADDL